MTLHQFLLKSGRLREKISNHGRSLKEAANIEAADRRLLQWGTSLPSSQPYFIEEEEE